MNPHQLKAEEIKTMFSKISAERGNKLNQDSIKAYSIYHVEGILNLHTLDPGKGLMISGCNEDYLFWQGVLTHLQAM